jgi:hypothetical protein
MGSKFQRFITRCDFDHVALLLRYKNDKIVLFESTGTAVNPFVSLLIIYRESICCHGTTS